MSTPSTVTLMERMNAIQRVTDVGQKYHDAVCVVRQARSERDAARPIEDSTERAVADEKLRHAEKLLELRRDQLLDALDAAHGLVDDRPKAGRPEAA